VKNLILVSLLLVLSSCGGSGGGSSSPAVTPAPIEAPETEANSRSLVLKIYVAGIYGGTYVDVRSSNWTGVSGIGLNSWGQQVLDQTFKTFTYNAFAGSYVDVSFNISPNPMGFSSFDTSLIESDNGSPAGACVISADRRVARCTVEKKVIY